MSFAKVYSAQVNLLRGPIVTIEVDLSRGLHVFSVVGLPDKAVDESKDRVIKIARTIVDLGNSPEVESPHILEAIQYRPKVNS